MITTNLTLTNGVTSVVPVQVTGITFQAETKLTVNPATTFPFTIAIDSSVVVGIDFDETINNGNYEESLTINTLGGRHDLVHAVNIVDENAPSCTEFVIDGDFTGSIGNIISQSGALFENLNGTELKITSDGASNYSSGYWTYLTEVGQSIQIEADVILATDSARFLDQSSNGGGVITTGEHFSHTVIVGDGVQACGFGGNGDSTYEIVLDNVSICTVEAEPPVGDYYLTTNGDYYVTTDDDYYVPTN